MVSSGQTGGGKGVNPPQNGYSFLVGSGKVEEEVVVVVRPRVVDVVLKDVVAVREGEVIVDPREGLADRVGMVMNPEDLLVERVGNRGVMIGGRVKERGLGRGIVGSGGRVGSDRGGNRSVGRDRGGNRFVGRERGGNKFVGRERGGNKLVGRERGGSDRGGNRLVGRVIGGNGSGAGAIAHRPRQNAVFEQKMLLETQVRPKGHVKMPKPQTCPKVLLPAGATAAPFTSTAAARAEVKAKP